MLSAALLPSDGTSRLRDLPWLCFDPAAENMAAPFGPLEALFQIGEDKYGYKYRLTKMRANGSPVFQCIRSTEPGCMVKCLWLYRSADGHWIATEASKTEDDPINEGTPTFRTKDPVEDIRVRQTLQWQYFKPESVEWEGAMSFETYPMMARRDSTTAAGSGTTDTGTIASAAAPLSAPPAVVASENIDV